MKIHYHDKPYDISRTEFIETTISEHIYNQGRITGKIEGKLEALENLLRQGVLSSEQFEKMANPLRQQLNSFASENQNENSAS